MTKQRIAVICGGPSAEHEVSLQSARNIVNAVDRERFEVCVIGISRNGRWHRADADDFLIHADDPKRIAFKTGSDDRPLLPGQAGTRIADVRTDHALSDIDVVFPIIHGTFGEDGTLQGLLRAANLAFVGSSVAGSAVAMDKDIAKRLLRDAGLAVAPFAVFNRATAPAAAFDALVNELGQPLFVKPANQGSSVGVSRVDDASDFDAAMELALKFDHKVLVEAAVHGREIECAVLGNDEPIASTCGEIIIESGGFYAYDTKYVDDNAARVVVPAEIDEASNHAIQRVAVRAFEALECAGLARVDMFLQADGHVVVNEVNTLPGFTRISMYPKLWQASGMTYADLVTRLIELALERHTADRALRNEM